MEILIHEELPKKAFNRDRNPFTRINLENTQKWIDAAVANPGEWVSVDVRDICDAGRIEGEPTLKQWRTRAGNLRGRINAGMAPWDEYEFRCLVRDYTVLCLMAVAEEDE